MYNIHSTHITQFPTSFASVLFFVGLGVTCSPRDPRFAGSNPAEIGGFFSGRRSPQHNSSAVGPESEISGFLKNLNPEKIIPFTRIDIYLFKVHSNSVLPSTPRPP